MPPPFEASPEAMGMALKGGEVNAGNAVYYLPVGLYSTSHGVELMFSRNVEHVGRANVEAARPCDGQAIPQ